MIVDSTLFIWKTSQNECLVIKNRVLNPMVRKKGETNCRLKNSIEKKKRTNNC